MLMPQSPSFLPQSSSWWLVAWLLNDHHSSSTAMKRSIILLVEVDDNMVMVGGGMLGQITKKDEQGRRLVGEMGQEEEGWSDGVMRPRGAVLQERNKGHLLGWLLVYTTSLREEKAERKIGRSKCKSQLQHSQPQPTGQSSQ